ncbi:MAG TPA: ABC transporter substrate-binding protein [Xanthobacteraceae bacterium]|nr:ABC transporter substrate-binding protein [Xanthobacteraceae bacterium]
MKRRTFITLLGSAAAAWPLAARAQQPATPVIGFLSGRSPNDSIANVIAFQRGLGELGYFDGQNVEIDFRWALSHYDQLPALASDLVRRKVTVIVATGGGVTSTRAAKAATSSIPIIFVSGGDPIDFGLVESLNKPGGNLTGVSFLLGALEAKRLELLHELLPKAALIGALVNPTFPASKTRLEDAQVAAQALGKKLVVVHASTEGELKTAFATLTQQRIEALDIIADPFLVGHAEQIVALAARNALPTISPLREFAVAGGLVSYGTSIMEAHRLAGIYAGRILKGAKPTDLPVEQPTKFELVINLNTARSLGLEIPPTLLATADEVIE